MYHKVGAFKYGKNGQSDNAVGMSLPVANSVLILGTICEPWKPVTLFPKFSISQILFHLIKMYCNNLFVN